MLRDVEDIRAQFRPPHITTLFIGESAPASGDFFYHGNTQMLRYMRRAVESVLGQNDDFLKAFKNYGWYLDDLVLTPVNHMGKSDRKAKCLAAQSGLAVRIAEYQPASIVSLMIGIEKIVGAASVEARSSARQFSVPFPGNGQQTRFHKKMVEIIPKLSRL